MSELHQYGSPYGPILRYSVAVELPSEGRTVRYRSRSSQGPHRAAAGAVMRHLHLNPGAVIGAIEIESVEERYIAELDDLVDYWDVA